MKVGTLFERIFNEQLTSDVQKKRNSYSDKKSDLLIKQREEKKNIRSKHSQQLNNLRLKQNSAIDLLKKKHREQLSSLYGRTMN